MRICDLGEFARYKLPYYAPTLRVGALSDDACLTSVVYIGPKSRTERSRKTEIGTEVAHVTRDSDTTFKVKGQRSGAQHSVTAPLQAAQLVIMVITTSSTTTFGFLSL